MKNSLVHILQGEKGHVHFIGVCGVAMGPLAVLFKEMGWKVSGSDRAFFPPMSTHLRDHGVSIMPGFKEEHLHLKPDLIVVTAFATRKNPELVYAIRNNIPYFGYGEVLPHLLERRNSIVVAGDHGKTSITALMAWALEVAGKSPSFMIGGIPKNFENGIRKSSSDWSVLEGDEYPVLDWKRSPRFLCYHPRYLILTDVRWDHREQYPTREVYLDIFRRLIRKVPKDGAIIACRDSKLLRRILKDVQAPIVWYSGTSLPTFMKAPFPGDIWRENAAAVYTLLHHLHVSDALISKAFRTFRGVKRRQEIRLQKKNVVIIDDFAHTPVKVAGGVQAVKEMFPGHALVAIYEPGDRSDEALKERDYFTCFKGVDYLILPKVSTIFERRSDFNERLAKKITRRYPKVIYENDDTKVIQDTLSFIHAYPHRKTAIVFMSQKGFRGMIEETIRRLRKKIR